MRSGLFWKITRLIVVIPYRKFRDNLTVPSSRIKILSLEDGSDRLSRNVGKELSTIRCVISQTSADLMGTPLTNNEAIMFEDLTTVIFDNYASLVLTPCCLIDVLQTFRWKFPPLSLW